VLQVPPEAVEAPADDDIESASLDVTDQVVERRPTILGAADAAVDVLGGGPAPRLDKAPEFLELILRFLVERADVGVDGSAHGNLRAVGFPLH